MRSRFRCHSLITLWAAGLVAAQTTACSSDCERTSSLSLRALDRVAVSASVACVQATECDFSSIGEAQVSLTSHPCFDPDGTIDVRLNGMSATARGADASQTVDVLGPDAECHCDDLIIESLQTAPISFEKGLKIEVGDDFSLRVPNALLPGSMKLALAANQVIAADALLVLTWTPADATPPAAYLELCGAPASGTCADDIAFDVVEMGPGRRAIRIPDFKLGLTPGRYEIRVDWGPESSGQCGDAPCLLRAQATMRTEVEIR